MSKKKEPENESKSESCTLGKPILMVIPDEGAKICCPVHGHHFIYGARVKF